MCRCCGSQISCCCGPEPCGLCCSCLPAFKQSLSTRLMYTIYLLFATVVSCLMLSSDVQQFMKTNIPHFNETCFLLQAGESCSRLVGYLAVYKISLTMVIFHILLAIFTLCIFSGNGWRSNVHNGFWCLKSILIIGVCIGVFFLPHDEMFMTVWMYIGMIGGALFIIFQVILLVDFAHRWHNKWYGYSKMSTTAWNCALYFSATLFLVICGAGVVLLYIYYTRAEHCIENKLFIGINASLCLLICFVSVLPCTTRSNPNSGLLQGTIISLYIIYLTWTAFVSEPDREDTRLYVNQSTTVSTLSNVEYNDTFLEWSEDQSLLCRPPSFNKSWQNISGYVGAVLMLLMSVYASLMTSNKSERLGITPTMEHTDYCCCCCMNTNLQDPSKRGGQKVIYDENEKVVYSYSFFHFIFAIGNLYIMMQLTMWYKPENSSLKEFGRNWPSVWVKIVSCWICVIVYIFTLFVPRCIPGQDFAYGNTAEHRGMLV